MNKTVFSQGDVNPGDEWLQRRKALSRWDGEGGAGPDGPQEGWDKSPLSAENAKIRRVSHKGSAA